MNSKFNINDSMIKIVYFLVVSMGILTGCRSSSDMKGASGSTGIDTADPWIRYSYSERRGKTLYDHYCSHCHGMGGRGDGANAVTLNPSPGNLADSTFMAAKDDTTLIKRIASGKNGDDPSVLMPRYSKTLTNDEIAFIVAYIRTFSNQ